MRSTRSDRPTLVIDHPADGADTSEERFTRGQVVDHFKILRFLGRGSMGEVYLARDMRLNRKIALKLVHLERLDTKKLIDRFLFEAEATAKFSHPHIVTLFAVGEFRGRPYLALEYLEGQDLGERIAVRSPGVPEAMRIGQAVAEALEHAHAHGILHRDLKPQNIIIPKDGRIRVVDFGLAKRVEGAEAAGDLLGIDDSDCQNRPHQSRAGTIKGTPEYMAPEQWTGEECTAATDVWGLGMIMYELLSGRLPYSETTFAKQAVAVCSSDPVPRLEGLQAVPEELLELVYRCLEKDPAARPPTRAVVAELQRLRGERGFKLDREESPYRGLLAFSQEHAGLFFGREAETAAFVERVQDTPVLPVVGPSGVGKSSFVQAGVIPRLREEERWLVIQIRPGSRPFETLVSRLRAMERSTMRSAGASPSSGRTEWRRISVFRNVDPTGDDDERIVKLLERDPTKLAVALREIAEYEGSNVLLFADQLEELFTLVPEEETQRRFLRALITAADAPEDPIRVVFTIRDDFLGMLGRDREVREAIQQLMVLQAPEPEGLRQILTRPLAMVGYRFEDPAIVDEMIASVGSDVGGLPLLQFAARMLWDHRDRQSRVLKRASYEAMGGVAGALAKHAEGVLEGMSGSELTLARQMFLRLVTPDRTRRVLSWTQLLDGLGSEGRRVAGRLTQSRLISLRKTSRAGDAEASVELAHESLVNTWARLSRWLEEGREDMVFLAEVGQAAELWDKRRRPEDEVWHGEALQDALRSLNRCAAPVPETVRDFLEAGRTRELARLRRRRWLIWAVAALSVLITVSAVAVALIVAEKERETQRQRNRAEARRAEAQSEGARAALTRGRYLEARAKLRGALETRDTSFARALWWRASKNPILWERKLGGFTTDVAFSPAGDLVAAASTDNAIYLIDRRTRGVRVLRGHSDHVYSVAFSPDGALLASGSRNGEIRLWRVESGTLEKTLDGHDMEVPSLAFNANGRKLASASGDGTVVIWDLAAGTEERTFEGHQGGVADVAFDADGRVMGSASWDGTARLWSVESGKLIRVLRGHKNGVTSIAFDPQGERVLTASTDGTVKLWNPNTGRVLETLEGHEGRVWDAAFAPNRPLIASAGEDGAVRMWDAETGELREERKLHDAGVYALAFSRDGRWIASGGEDEVARLSSVDSAGQTRVVEGHSAAVWAGVDFSADGGLVASSGADKTARIWDVRSGRQLVVLEGHTGAVIDLDLNPTGDTIATASRDRSIRLWDTESGTLKLILGGHAAGAANVAFNRDGRLLLSADIDGELRLWDVRTGALKHVIAGHDARIWCTVFSPDGRTFASSSLDGTVRIWDTETGELERTLTGHHSGVLGLAFSPDGRRLASGDTEGSIRLWDVETGKGRQLGVAKGRVHHIRFHPTRPEIVFTCSDGTARSWDLESGREVAVFTGHSDEVNGLALSPDGRLAATGSDDGTLRVWRTSDAQPYWRTTALLVNPPAAVTHEGWIDLAGEKGAEKLAGTAWAKALVERGRVAHQSKDGTRICLQSKNGTLEYWKQNSDERVFAIPLKAVDDVIATDQGCIVQVDGKIAILDLQAQRRNLEVGSPAHAMTYDDDELLVVTNTGVISFDRSGRRIAEYETGVGTEAAARVEEGLIVGYKEGNIALVQAGGHGVQIPFEAVPASPVTRILKGPLGTVFVGYRNGFLGIWDRTNGTRIDHSRLHGALSHMRIHGELLLVTTDLGRHGARDIGIFQMDYCDLVRDVWSKVPVVWEGGHAVVRAPPENHRCLAAADP